MTLQGKAVLLLSGGLDSATLLYWADRRGYRITPLFFAYGQRHAREAAAAQKLVSLLGLTLTVINISLPWEKSVLLDPAQPLPESAGRPGGRADPPATYVSGRNLIFLSFALSCAEATGARTVLIGANSVDYSGYPDCRPGFYRRLNRLAGVVTGVGPRREGIRVLTPLMKLSKAGIIRLGGELGVPYRFTWSCYAGGDMPCGRCDSCRIRAKGFAAAGRLDPLTEQEG